MFLKATAQVLRWEDKKREFRTVLVSMEKLWEGTTTQKHEENYFKSALKANKYLTNNGKDVMVSWSNEIVNAELWEKKWKLLVETKMFSNDQQTDIEILD